MGSFDEQEDGNGDALEDESMYYLLLRMEKGREGVVGI